jgi:3-deoxy-manno-octulosonate cytidylyltransferase (CMP-KDO synthetase)
MKVVGVIPARYGSTRLEGKPLKDICGKMMIQHVYEQTCKSELISRVIVATDDTRIYDAVRGFGGEAAMTSATHKTGTDRVAEVVNNIECDIVVNIQGDEPLIIPEVIDEIARALYTDEEIYVSTGSYKISDERMLHDPNVVKVVTDKNGLALYFSRSLIPYPRHVDTFEAFEHIGIYAFKKDFLLKFINFENTPLSLTESLEQLKVLELGYKIRVIKTKHDYQAISVDTPEDLEEVRKLVSLRANEKVE